MESSPSSVGIILEKRGFKYKKVTSNVCLGPEEKQGRVDFCREMLIWRGKKVRETFFFYEMGISLSDAFRDYACSKPGVRVRVGTTA